MGAVPLTASPDRLLTMGVIEGRVMVLQLAPRLLVQRAGVVKVVRHFQIYQLTVSTMLSVYEECLADRDLIRILAWIKARLLGVFRRGTHFIRQFRIFLHWLLPLLGRRRRVLARPVR